MHPLKKKISFPWPLMVILGQRDTRGMQRCVQSAHGSFLMCFGMGCEGRAALGRGLHCHIHWANMSRSASTCEVDSGSPRLCACNEWPNMLPSLSLRERAGRAVGMVNAMYLAFLEGGVKWQV